MDYGMPRRVVMEEDGTHVVEAGSCKLIALFCTSVGMTDLPATPPPTTEPPPEQSGPPTITSVTPDTGPAGTLVEILGSGFQEQGPGSKVVIGAAQNPVEATIQSWEVDAIVVEVAQDALADDIPWPVYVHAADGQVSSGSPAPSFTFTAVAREGTGRKGSKKSRKRRGAHAEVQVEEDSGTFPTFESGAGVMLTSSDGKEIYVGPFELQAGRLYPLPVACSNGLALRGTGAYDVTFIATR